MKKGIHPNYYPDAKVTCACGNTWTTGSTRKEIRTEVCSACHPFFTGQQQRLVDIEGQVDRFYRKLQARQSFVDQQRTREESRTSLARPVAELELGTRPTDALTKAGGTKPGTATGYCSPLKTKRCSRNPAQALLMGLRLDGAPFRP